MKLASPMRRLNTRWPVAVHIGLAALAQVAPTPGAPTASSNSSATTLPDANTQDGGQYPATQIDSSDQAPPIRPRPATRTSSSPDIARRCKARPTRRRIRSASPTTIFAEDIGKFPDTNIGRIGHRIPGVTISREVTGEGANVAIRGLGTNFTRVLLNGAPVAIASSASTRRAPIGRSIST